MRIVLITKLRDERDAIACNSRDCGRQGHARMQHQEAQP